MGVSQVIILILEQGSPISAPGTPPDPLEQSAIWKRRVCHGPATEDPGGLHDQA